MRGWLGGRTGALAGFLLIASLVAGGLGWVTEAALRLEKEQHHARAEAEQASKLRLALWRMDARVSPLLAREDSRPYNHFSAVYRPTDLFLRRGNRAINDSATLAISPLLSVELPDWMVLHFQVDAESGWGSPQVPFAGLLTNLREAGIDTAFKNATPERACQLRTLTNQLPVPILLAALEQKGSDPVVPDRTVMLFPGNTNQMLQAQSPYNPQQATDPDIQSRFSLQGKLQNDVRNSINRDYRDNAYLNLKEQGRNWLAGEGNTTKGSVTVNVRLSTMMPVWVSARQGQDLLLLVRKVQLEDAPDCEVCQGVVLDLERLQSVLAAEIDDLFPQASFSSVREGDTLDPERTMAVLPLKLEPGPLQITPRVTWTPLRIGLALSWAAALLGLLAVGLGGAFLLDLSERRFRFVSAVTHELRTPLTTLRLYLDMLLGGMVRDQQHRDEYLQTLHDEAERLGRLVNNVLDFSRLEQRRARVSRTPLALEDFLTRLREIWHKRCQDAGKELVVLSALPTTYSLETDAELLLQILSNLLDNACKYSREAEDPHIWLRVDREAENLIFEVEDRGPGVPAAERKSVFRAFRRGRTADTVGGGVGLGLALARRWARMLGGELVLSPRSSGACFRLTLRTF